MSSRPPAGLQPHQTDLIAQAMAADALLFGEFTLKSGRVSPYFFNAGLLSTGPILATLGGAYAATIAAAGLPAFDVLFGPAYKGIPLAACAALLLHTQHGVAAGFAYDRKEAKDHGEGGRLVGVPVRGRRVLILDDVMTAGTAIRGAMATIAEAGGEVVGVVQCLDREEVGRDGVTSTVQELEGVLGAGRVLSILKMRDLMVWLEEKGMADELRAMRAYRDKYGVKE